MVRKTAPDVRPRDRAQTERAIVAAARNILLAEGYSQLGINAIAREAKADKVLIYRYFGGLEGLAERLGEDIGAEIEQWLTAQAKPETVPLSETYAEVVSGALIDFWRGLQAHPAFLQLVLWELNDPSPLVQRMAKGRSRRLSQWLSKRLGGIKPVDQGIDAPAINAVLISGLQMLAIFRESGRPFAGLSLRGAEAAARVDKAITLICRGVFSSIARAR